MAIISGHNLSCIKQQRCLFSDLNFAVDASQILHVKGPNGAGKTSLLRIVTGLVASTEGQIHYHDKPIDSCQEQFQKDLVYFGHKLGLNLALNAVENLQFWCHLNQISVRADELYPLLADLGLVGLEDLTVNKLSAGQQRRVALARLWLKKHAKLWVLDEPFTALDVDGIALLQSHIVQHLERGGAVITTSHQTLQLGYPVQELNLAYQL